MFEHPKNARKWFKQFLKTVLESLFSFLLEERLERGTGGAKEEREGNGRELRPGNENECISKP
jgi:hypothetical protein